MIVCVCSCRSLPGFLAGLNLAWTALAGAALVMVLARRDTHEVLKLVDWHLLVFFAALFIVVDGLSDTGSARCDLFGICTRCLDASVTAQAGTWPWFSVAWLEHFLECSVCARRREMDRATLPEPDLMWKVLALATTFAGNLTIVGSVANMIVVESVRDHIQVGFWDYARFGIPITILTTAAGVFSCYLFYAE